MPLWRSRARMALADVEGFPTEQAIFKRAHGPHALPGRERNMLLNVPGLGLGEPTRSLCHSIDFHAHECKLIGEGIEEGF